jgi:EmrB/QacA subfamily drug resistance transporter
MAEQSAVQIKKKGIDLKWWVLLTVIIGTFLGRLDQTIVSLATPKMMEDFNITTSMAGWISTAYILANAVFVPIWGKLGDTIGRKKVYIMGFLIFIVGSVLAGLAWNFPSMILFRVIQAIASSADYPTAMAILAVTFRDGKERNMAMGIWSSAFAASSVFGPLIGGPLIDNFGWRSVFLVNLPVGLLGLFMASIFVTESVSGEKNPHFDWWGAITLGIALTSFVLVLDKGYDWGWFSISSILCYISTILFTLIFQKIEKKSPEPIVDLKFFSNGGFVNVIANNFIVFVGLIGCTFLIPIFAQQFLGYSATETGYLFIPMAFVMLLAAPIGASLSSSSIKPGYVIAGSTLVAGIGLSMLTSIDARSTAWDIILPMLVMSFGMGFGMAQRTSAVTSLVPASEMGVASSILALARNIAGAFGIALFNTILNNSIERNVLDISRASTFNGTTAIAYQQFISLITFKAQIDAYSTVFWVGAVVLFIGAFLALFLRVENTNSKQKVMVE